MTSRLNDTISRLRQNGRAFTLSISIAMKAYQTLQAEGVDVDFKSAYGRGYWLVLVPTE